MGKLALIVGGARSGKSTFAQKLAFELGGSDVLFLATAEGADEEMSDRIARHRAERPQEWETREVPRFAGEELKSSPSQRNVILLDCLTLWVSNILLSYPEEGEFSEIEDQLRSELSKFLKAVAEHRGTTIVVSGEVGQGIVPESKLARRYRDLLGWANQMVAARADSTFQLIAGLAVDIAKLSQSVELSARELQGATN